MRALGLCGIWPGRSIRTTRPTSCTEQPKDLLRRDFTADRPNQCWAVDFTYVRTRSGFCYLAFVVDLFSRRIVGSATAAGRILNSCSVPWSRRSDNARTVKVTASRVSYTTGDHGSQYLSITYSDRGSWEGVDAFTGQVSSSYDYAAAEALSKPYERELIWTRS